MSYKVTNKAVKETHTKVLAAGYCSLHNLLQYRNRSAYTAGVYGWNSDIYSIGTVAISTGYRPTGQHIPYDLIKKYETKAIAINKHKTYKPETKRAKIDDLIYQLIEEVI